MIKAAGLSQRVMKAGFYDVIVIGGAVMGSSVAYHLLAAEPSLKLAVVERDPAYTRASSSLSLGGVRIQFSLRENILISLYAQECFSRFEEEMAVRGKNHPSAFARKAIYS